MQIHGEVPLADLEIELQETLAALREIDQWYDWERKLLRAHPEPIRKGLISGLEKRRRQNREPYVQYLAQIYHILNSTRLFKDSTLLSVGALNHSDGYGPHDRWGSPVRL